MLAGKNNTCFRNGGCKTRLRGESEGVAGTVFSCVAAWFVGERFPDPVHCDAVCGAKGGLVDLEVGFGHGV